MSSGARRWRTLDAISPSRSGSWRSPPPCWVAVPERAARGEPRHAHGGRARHQPRRGRARPRARGDGARHRGGDRRGETSTRRSSRPSTPGASTSRWFPARSGSSAFQHVRQVAPLYVEALHLLVKQELAGADRRGPRRPARTRDRRRSARRGERGPGRRRARLRGGARRGRHGVRRRRRSASLEPAELEALVARGDPKGDAGRHLPSRYRAVDGRAKAGATREIYRLEPLPFADAIRMSALLREGFARRPGCGDRALLRGGHRDPRLRVRDGPGLAAGAPTHARHAAAAGLEHSAFPPRRSRASSTPPLPRASRTIVEPPLDRSVLALPRAARAASRHDRLQEPGQVGHHGGQRRRSLQHAERPGRAGRRLDLPRGARGSSEGEPGRTRCSGRTCCAWPRSSESPWRSSSPRAWSSRR